MKDQSTRTAEANDGHLMLLLAIGHLSQVVATWPLWTPQSVYPQVPLVSIANLVPQIAEWALLVALLLSVVGLLLHRARCCSSDSSPRPSGERWGEGASFFFRLSPSIRLAHPGSVASNSILARSACLMMGISTFALICIDQHRLQPWAWQFIILSMVLATADGVTSAACWRWLVISIYCWSAWSKVGDGFGLFILAGFFKAIGLPKATLFWPEAVSRSVSLAIPCCEFLIAVCLATRQTRIPAVVFATIMHTVLLVALGPFGYGHSPGVLIWNIFFIVQNWILFTKSSVFTSSERPISRQLPRYIGNRFAQFMLVAAMIWPSLESVGLCDRWPAWAVYATDRKQVSVFVHSDEMSKLSPELKRYIGPQLITDEWHPFRIDRWSLDTVFAPIYPQDRFHLGVAIALAQRYELSLIRVSIRGPQLPGRKGFMVKDEIGLESLNRLAKGFRCNAKPRP